MLQLYAAKQDRRAQGRRFVRHVYPLRVLGMLLFTLPYGSILFEQQAPFGYWVVAFLHVMVWPHVAFWLSWRGREPLKLERCNLIVDAVWAGFWIAVSSVSLVPAVAVLSVLSADRMAAGGWRLLWRALLAAAMSFLLSWWWLGFGFELASSMRTTGYAVASWYIYILGLSHVTYQFARQVNRQNRELDRLQLTDVGVDLPNRRFFHAHASEQIAAARRCNAPTVLLLIDVDYFKSINDRHGHGAGDDVLREIARLLREQAGPGGFPARIGGDEFTLLLPAPLGEGEAAASRLREAAAALVLPRYPQLRIGLSIGVAQLSGQHRSLDDWMGAADRAMYQAKAAGRARR